MFVYESGYYKNSETDQFGTSRKRSLKQSTSKPSLTPQNKLFLQSLGLKVKKQK